MSHNTIATREADMSWMRMHAIGWTGIIGMLLTVGCASTRVNFNAPPNTVMFVDGKPYHLPTQIEMGRPPGPGASTRHDVSLVATVNSNELRAKGHIDVFGYEETDADRLAINTCNLDEDQLAKIFDGNVLVFKGNSATRQPLYELTLGKK
jgi:hypothetical protein